MKRRERQMVEGFIAYLQTIYGEGGTAHDEELGGVQPANTTSIPMFLTVDGGEAADDPLLGGVATLSQHQALPPINWDAPPELPDDPVFAPGGMGLVGP